MKNRKKWWNVGLIHYSKFVQFYFLLALSLMIFGSNVIFKAYFMLPKIDWMLWASILIVLSFIYSFTQCIKRMKKEYAEKNLGY